MKRIALLLVALGVIATAVVVGSALFAHHKFALNWGPPVTASMVVHHNWGPPVTAAMVHPVAKH